MSWLIVCLAVAALFSIILLFLWAMQEEQRDRERTEDWKR